MPDNLTTVCLFILAIFLPGANIEEEISRDRNMNIAWIGGTMSISIAALIFFLL